MIVLYDRTSRLLFGLALKILGNRTSAEEVLLDTYTQVWRKSGSYDYQRTPVLAWMIATVRAKALARLRSQDKVFQSQELHGVEPHSVTVAPDQQKLARSVVESLTQNQREVIELAYYSGLSCSDIAAQLGKPIGAVKTHMRLGMAKLGESFRPLFEVSETTAQEGTKP